MDLHVSLDRRTNLTAQLYQQIRSAVLDGQLRPGEALPPSRELARQLVVSRNTVGAAYDRLAAEGYLTTRAGAGTYVNALPLPDACTAGVSAVIQPEGLLRPRPMWTNMPSPPDFSGTPAFDFRPGLPDARLFPYATWRRLLGEQLYASAVGTAYYHEPAGHLGLRVELVRHIGISRAVHAAPEDVTVTTGIQQAIDLVARVLLEPGACVAVERPGYLPARLLFESLGARVVGVPLDAEGLVVDDLPADARLVYVTPSHQFPTGVAMSLRRRMSLLAWTERHDAALLEDDYDSEFRYAGQALEPLQSLDRAGRVLYVGSLSKVMLPTLRLGFLIAPPSLRQALRRAKYVTDWHTALPAQAALAGFVAGGGLARHIRRMRGVYRVRHECIADALAGPLSEWLEPVPSAAGLHLSAALRNGTGEDPSRLAALAEAAGVGLLPVRYGAPFGSIRPMIVLGFGGIPTERIAEGLRRLRRCLAVL